MTNRPPGTPRSRTPAALPTFPCPNMQNEPNIPPHARPTTQMRKTNPKSKRTPPACIHLFNPGLSAGVLPTPKKCKTNPIIHPLAPQLRETNPICPPPPDQIRKTNPISRATTQKNETNPISSTPSCLNYAKRTQFPAPLPSCPLSHAQICKTNPIAFS